MKTNPFEYIQNYYGKHIKKGARVKQPSKDKTGTVAKADGQYIHILWDGDLKTTGPYHPTSDLEYLEELS